MLVWAIKPCKKVRQGDIVGSLTGHGYYHTSYKGNEDKIHRLVWQLHYGDIPKDKEIDHIDGDKANNAIDNLRLVTKQGNQWNRTDGKGYCFNKSIGKWQAYIHINNKMKHLGFYDTEAMAKEVRILAKIKYHKIRG